MTEEKTNIDFLLLKEKREVLGLTLKDVFQRTRISVINLEAIENGNLHLLPVPIYTKNFIKTYAQVLGIDSKPILESYENYLNSLAAAQLPSPEDIQEKISFLDKICRHKSYVWIAVAIVFITTVSLFFSSQYQSVNELNTNQAIRTATSETGKKTDVLPLPPLVTVPVNEPSKAILPPSSSNTASVAKPIPSQAGTAGQKNVAIDPRALITQNVQVTTTGEEVLIIRATEETWLRIKTGQNQTYQEVLLKPGEKIERKATSFDIDIGNAGGVKIQFKDKNIENIGKSGQVVHLRLP